MQTAQKAYGFIGKKHNSRRKKTACCNGLNIQLLRNSVIPSCIRAAMANASSTETGLTAV